jgi:hypothetical protein
VVNPRRLLEWMEVTHTAMVCLLFISAIVQFCTVALSTGCCCLSRGGAPLVVAGAADLTDC